MYFLQWLTALCCVSVAYSEVSLKRSGWLDRVVSFYRQLFITDVQQTTPVQLRARLEPLAPGTVVEGDELWDYPAVERMLTLLAASENSAPVRRALSLALRPSEPTRRFISKKQSWKLFPSLQKNVSNYIYYEEYEIPESSCNSSSEYSEDLEDDSVLVLENPVEARMPSARISVKALRKILESRANFARQMPSTTKSTIPWVTANTTASNDTATTTAETTAADDDKPTETDGAADATTAGDATADGDATTGGGEATATEAAPEGERRH